MQFVNHTPSPALAFMGVDQRGQQFHVVVVRQTLTWDETGQLMFCDAQPSLCEADQFFDGDIHSSVQEESDLCPYKPRCDVIVNATAHAPRGSNESLSKQFQVRLVVKRPEDPLMVKRESWASASQEIDLLMSSRSQDAVKTVSWDRHVDKSSERVPPLIDKTLTVTGKRCFVKGALAAEGKSGSCWSLTEAEPVCALPVRLEHTFGG